MISLRFRAIITYIAISGLLLAGGDLCAIRERASSITKVNSPFKDEFLGFVERAIVIIRTKQVIAPSIPEDVVLNAAEKIAILKESVLALNEQQDFDAFNSALLPKLVTFQGILGVLFTKKETETFNLSPVNHGGYEESVYLDMLRGHIGKMLFYLESRRRDIPTQWERAMQNTWIRRTIVFGLPVIGSSLCFYYRKELKPFFFLTKYFTFDSIKAVTVGSAALVHTAYTTLTQSPMLRQAVSQSVTVVKSEAYRKTFAAWLLGTCATALLWDANQGKLSAEVERELNKLKISPTRLCHELNAALRMDSESHLHWFLEVPTIITLGNILLGAIDVKSAAKQKAAFRVTHLSSLLSLKEGWLYNLLTLAGAHIEKKTNRMGFALYKGIMPYLEGGYAQPKKTAFFSLIAAGFMSGAIKDGYAAYESDTLPMLDKLFSSAGFFFRASEAIGALVCAAVLTNWIFTEPEASTSKQTHVAKKA